MNAPWSMSTFRAMGSDCRIIGPDATTVCVGEQLVHDLERRWSRFRPDSEIVALNAAAGHLTIVSAETYELVARAERARQLTDGVFNPLMLDQLEAAGYDRTWDRVVDVEAPAPRVERGSSERIELFADVSAIRLPAGTRFDPGGLGKGCAGDMVAQRLSELGAVSSQVELGGDVRLTGPHWSGGQWPVRVDDSDHGVADVATIMLAEGGVATSSSVRRSWLRGGVEMHHLLDPMTGRPARTDLAAATVVAPTLWWAEVVSKAVIVLGGAEGRRLIERLGMSAVLVGRDRRDPYTVVEQQGQAA